MTTPRRNTKMDDASQQAHDKEVAEIYYMGDITQRDLGVYLGRSKSAILRTIQRAANQTTTPPAQD